MAIKHVEVDLEVRGIESRIHYLLQEGPDDVPVILLLHGHGSSVAEFDDLLRELEGKAVVFAFDQPSCGRSTNAVRQDVLSAYSAVEGARRKEALTYLRELTDAFVLEVIESILQRTGRQVRVAGGSLGGNLALLLAEQNPRYAWLEAAYCWSPGSAWRLGIRKRIAGYITRKRAQREWSEADIRPFLRAQYVEQVTHAGKTYPQPWYWYFDCWGEDAGPECQKQGNGACSRCHHKPILRMPEGDLLGPSDHYPSMSAKKAREIERALLAKAGTTYASRIAWHWELVAAQLALSHRSRTPRGLSPIETLQVPTMFMAGKEDRYFPAPLFEDTRACFELAEKRQGAPGAARVKARWFDATGHSLHNERPGELAAILTGPPL